MTPEEQEEFDAKINSAPVTIPLDELTPILHYLILEASSFSTIALIHGDTLNRYLGFSARKRLVQG